MINAMSEWRVCDGHYDKEQRGSGLNLLWYLNLLPMPVWVFMRVLQFHLTVLRFAQVYTEN